MSTLFFYKMSIPFSETSYGYYNYYVAVDKFLSPNKRYEIVFDNERYIDTPEEIISSSGHTVHIMGNLSITGLGEDTGEPFVVRTIEATNSMTVQAKSGSTHTLGIYELAITNLTAEYTGGPVAIGTDVTSLSGLTVVGTYEDGITLPVTDYTIEGTIKAGDNELVITCGGAITTVIVAGKLPDIIIKDRDGNDAIYSNARAIRVRTEDGVTKEYINSDALPPSGIVIDDKALNNMVYQVDNDNKLVTIYGILFSQLYAETDNATIYIPDIVGDCQVVIDSEGVR